MLLSLHRVIAAAALVAVCATGHARNCALSLADVGALMQRPALPAQWQETTMQDGKPLVVSLSERDGGLYLRFVKAGEGLWAEGDASVCMNNGVLEALLPSHSIRVGPAANWLLRQSLGNGARFALVPQPGGLLRIATPGWNGVFAPARE